MKYFVFTLLWTLHGAVAFAQEGIQNSRAEEIAANLACKIWDAGCTEDDISTTCNISNNQKQYDCLVHAVERPELTLNIRLLRSGEVIGAVSGFSDEPTHTKPISEAKAYAESLACKIWGGNCASGTLISQCNFEELPVGVSTYFCLVTYSNNLSDKKMMLQLAAD